MTPQNIDRERELFEAFASDDGEWLKAIERDARGNYLLLTTAVGWMWWRAARRAPVVPHTKVKPDFYWDSEKQHHVPTLLIEFEPVPAGEPCDSKGWTDRDNLAAMLAADALDGLLARDLNEDTDPDDEAFDDFAEDVEDNECHNCSGTGEGMYDSQSCVVCLGKGFL